ncbi:MAG TPA: FHA domain-containing protein [Polyangiaceae bacterium]|nr:FHA domain-containing protein [Polyangiaceae bacterium]
MNPFSATVAPDFSGAGAPPPGPPGYGTPPPAPQGYGAPPPQAYAPPQQAAYAPPQAYGAPQPQAYGAPQPQAYGAPQPQAYGTPAQQAQAPWQPPTPAPAQQAAPAWPNAAVPPGVHSHDPSVFAATAPPPTTDEFEAAVRRSQSPAAAPTGPSSPPVAAAVAPAAPLGPGRDPELVEAGAIRALAGFFVSYDQSEFGVFWPIYQGQNVIGRKGAGAGLDIEVDSPTTSSRHATVYASARPGRIKLEDGGSTNGTFLNDAPLERGKKYELRDSDTLRFGGFNVTVKII